MVQFRRMKRGDGKETLAVKGGDNSEPRQNRRVENMIGKSISSPREKAIKKSKMLTGGQAKIAAKAPPPNKIDAKDFAVLRAEKAKGRGMGLQDEKVKPGKVMKANLGLMFMKKAKDKGAKGLEFFSPVAMAKRILGKKSGGVMKYKKGSGLDLPVISSVKPTVNKSKRAQNLSKMKIQFNKQRSRTGKKPYSSMAEMRKAKGFKPGESASEFNKRRMALASAKQALKATRLGKIVLPIAAAGVAGQQYLKSKMNKNKKNKKMGGGMMKRPMGYKKGMSIKGDDKRDIRKTESMIGASKSSPREKAIKKMGGGMMMKPMGYKTGGGFDSGTPGKLRDAVERLKKRKPYNPNPSGATRPIRKSPKEKALSVSKKAAEALVKTTPLGAGIATVQTIKKLMSGRKEKSDKTGGASKRGSVNRRKFRQTPMLEVNMGGMMQKPMGYKSGTSVKVKCKLGRNKPTKMY